ncbi:tetratricopeptide repeat protein [Brevibacillus formosus]|uniref:tetratricopeptide repeat protein n=1 Tax=Brevibacillus formosus TaxID=54913 RepID=UPI001CA53DB3|nr:tetratricopeptide repeat protein [Brevibacillus formosus]MBW5469123.1 tetratricopeptide repeat protein [Brevibacillus formosus]
MNIWRILDIDPTEDISTIKKAYAKKLKLHHPEDDPEGYQQLREAYDLAIKMAKKGQRKPRMEPILVDPSTPVEEEVDEEVPTLTIQRVLSMDDVHEQLDRDDQVDSIDDFIEQVQALYDDFPSRINPENWTRLLHSDLVWDIQKSRLVRDRLFDFLEEHHHLPKSVWVKLEECFHWRELSEKPYYMDEHSEEFCAYYRKQLDEPGLRFDTLLQATDIDHDLFLSYRDAAYQALIENQLELAASSLNAAIALFADDPDLLRLLGEYCQRIGDMDGAIDAFTRIISLQPDATDNYVARAYIWYNHQHFTEARNECDYILSQVPNHAEALSLLGKCQLELGDAALAKATFQQLLAANPHDYQALIMLTQLRADMVKQAKTLPAKERELALQPLITELGERKGLHTQTKQALRFQVIFTTVILALIMLFHSLLSGAFEDHTGLGPISYVKHAVNGPIHITSAYEFDRMEPDQFITTRITDAHPLGIFQYQQTDADGKSTTTYESYMSVAKKGSNVAPSAWVYIGHLDGSPVILLATAEQAVRMNETKTLEIEHGKTQEIPEEVLDDAEEILQQPGLKSTYDTKYLVTDHMIDAKQYKPSWPPFSAAFYGIILLLLYRVFFRSLYKIYLLTRF